MECKSRFCILNSEDFSLLISQSIYKYYSSLLWDTIYRESRNKCGPSFLNWLNLGATAFYIFWSCLWWIIKSFKFEKKCFVFSLERYRPLWSGNKLKVCLFVVFFRPHPWHMEVPGLGTETSPQQWKHPILSLLYCKGIPMLLILKVLSGNLYLLLRILSPFIFDNYWYIWV